MTDVKSRVILSAAGGPIFIVAIIFLSAGKFNYWQGIFYTALTLGMLVVLYMSVRKNKELINERLAPGKGTKSWDRTYWKLSSVLFFSAIILACLDAGRFQWSPALPIWLYAASGVVYVVGQLIFLWARSSNKWFSSVVRIQRDRGQTVCEDGPYRYVRHPGYLGGLLFTLVTPLLLGSLWAILPTAIYIILMLVRLVLEDKTLEIELDGYKEYKGKVKYRLLPHVW